MGEELVVRPSRDGDGGIVRMVLRAGEPGRYSGPSLELALEEDPASKGPCLALRELAGGRRLYRSSALPGTLFEALRQVWADRRGEGIMFEVGPASGPTEPVALGRVAFDFTGALARARTHEAAGRTKEAIAEYRRSTAPGAAEAAARLAGERSAPPAPVLPGLAEEDAVKTIVRAIVADGKIDPSERAVLQGLARFFALDRARLEAVVRGVAAEPRPAGGQPLVPQEVLRALIQRALGAGKIGPGSSKVLNEAANALGLDRERILAMVRR